MRLCGFVLAKRTRRTERGKVAYAYASAAGASGFDPGDRTGLGDGMLDGDRYFASFPDERSQAAHERAAASKRLLTPELLAALAELDRELRSFVNETVADTSSETSNRREA